jgi:hypothetical protein
MPLVARESVIAEVSGKRDMTRLIRAGREATEACSETRPGRQEMRVTAYQTTSAMVGRVTANFSPAMRLTSRM